MCAHLGKEAGKPCTFSGNCIVNTYNLHGMGSFEKFMTPVSQEVKAEEIVTEEIVPAVVAFNPFQRGNGCLLEDMNVHTR
jgi:hypothetical protein